VTPPALRYISGTTRMPFFAKTSSASGVKRPVGGFADDPGFTLGAFSPLITFSSAAGIRISHSSSSAARESVRFVAPGKFRMLPRLFFLC